MENNFYLVFGIGCTCLALCAIILANAYTYLRARRWNPAVRAALTRAYQDVTFFRLNRLPGGKTYDQCEKDATASFERALGLLDRNDYAGCIRAAEKSVTLVRLAWPSVLWQPLPRPIPPSMRIVSRGDFFPDVVWLG